MARKKKIAPLPKQLEDLKRDLDLWRSQQRKKAPIPDDMWDRAVHLAGVYGIHSVSRHLRVCYTSVKERVEQSYLEKEEAKEEESGFVEIRASEFFGSAPASQSRGFCLELCDSSGGRLKLHDDSGGGLDIAEVTRAFFGRGK